MSEKTVIIGCRLPNGLVLEIGYETTTSDVGGRLVTQVRKLANYQRIALKGWNAHSEEMRRQEIQVPAAMNTRPFLNRGVSKAAWEQWKAAHTDSWLIKNGILFEAENEPDAQVKAGDIGKDKLTVLAPLDKNALPKGVEQADFTKKAG
jgi:hypothetical protein